MPKKNRPHGHYCKICGQYKANEKFSGKNHATHICKACSGLSAAEKTEKMTMHRLSSFPMRRLSDSEKKWLANCIQDKRPKVAAMAQEVYNICFPYARRNAMKKQLLVNTLIFEIHTEVCDEYGDFHMANQRFTADRKSHILTIQNFDTDKPEQSIMIDDGDMTKLLHWSVHTLEIFMWEQDYPLSPAGITDIDLRPDTDVFIGENELPYVDLDSEPYWHVHVEYANHAIQDTACYEEYFPDKPKELYDALLEYFQPVEIDFCDFGEME